MTLISASRSCGGTKFSGLVSIPSPNRPCLPGEAAGLALAELAVCAPWPRPRSALGRFPFDLLLQRLPRLPVLEPFGADLDGQEDLDVRVQVDADLVVAD